MSTRPGRGAERGRPSSESMGCRHRLLSVKHGTKGERLHSTPGPQESCADGVRSCPCACTRICICPCPCICPCTCPCMRVFVCDGHGHVHTSVSRISAVQNPRHASGGRNAVERELLAERFVVCGDGRGHLWISRRESRVRVVEVHVQTDNDRAVNLA